MTSGIGTGSASGNGSTRPNSMISHSASSTSCSASAEQHPIKITRHSTTPFLLTNAEQMFDAEEESDIEPNPQTTYRQYETTV